MVTTLFHVSARHHPAMPALAAWQPGHGAMQVRPTRDGERQHDFRAAGVPSFPRARWTIRRGQTCRSRPSQYGARRVRLSIFPLGVRGSSSMMSTVRGHL
jgi:hypothetical protein